MTKTYETCAKGIRILPGQWRPHYPFEQIAWLSPPWPSQDYIWLDFPEAIFSNAGLLYLSHVNPRHPAVFEELSKVPWRCLQDGIEFERRLPNGMTFGGTVRAGDPGTVRLELFICNGNVEPLNNVRLQTCAYLRAIREFSSFTMGSKYVHIPEMGWVSFDNALKSAITGGRYSLGWRGGGPRISDLPVIAAVSSQAGRIVAMTWYKSTNSLMSNPDHPCIHADPVVPDLKPGQIARIRGDLIFFDGSLRDFGEWFAAREKRISRNVLADLDECCG